MKKVDFIIRAPHFFTMKGEGLGYLENAAMAIDRGKIIAINSQETIFSAFSSEKNLVRANHIILPGLIDAHMHTRECLLRGLAQDTKNWMMHGIGPFVMGLEPHHDKTGHELALLEAIRSGTTTFGEFSADSDSVCQLFKQTGVRGLITVTIREAREKIYEPGELYEFDSQLGKASLEECVTVFDRWNEQADGRINVLFGPQGPDFVSQDLLLNLKELALERKTRIHMHVQQGDRETHQLLKRYQKRPIPWLDEIGYLDHHLIAVHLTDANDREARMVANSGASMILCSGSIGIIDGIVPPAKVFLDSGGLVALGSDQAPGNNNHNIFNEMKLTALFNKIKAQDPEVFPAWQVLRMATIDGAKAVGLDQKVGSLEEGKCADFIAVDLTHPTLMPVHTLPMRNIAPNLVYSARGNEVDLVVIDGKIIYENGDYKTIDQHEVLERAQTLATELGAKASSEFQRINGDNARYMKEGKL